jgi:hypothetical protein
MTAGAVIMLPPIGPSPYEKFMGKVWQYAALDLISAFVTAPVQVFVAAPEVTWGEGQSGLVLLPDPPDSPFHFGGRLAGIVTEYGLQTVFYAGAGSAPLVSGGVFRRLVKKAAASPEKIVLTNNLHSSDWAVINQAQAALPVIRAQTRDNSLAWALQQAGYSVQIPIRRLAQTLDIDTPADVAILAQRHDLSARMAFGVQNLPHPNPAIEPLTAAFRREGITLALIGRVAPAAWGAVNKDFRIWTRVISEERGMVASGREERGEVRSVLAGYWRQNGPAAVIDVIATLADAALFDTRPLWAAVGLTPSAADRYASDALDWEQVRDPDIRAFTKAAAHAPIPILLGGHNVVSGGLHALIEAVQRKAKPKAAPQKRQAKRRPTP